MKPLWSQLIWKVNSQTTEKTVSKSLLPDDFNMLKCTTVWKEIANIFLRYFRRQAYNFSNESTGIHFVLKVHKGGS